MTMAAVHGVCVTPGVDGNSMLARKSKLAAELSSMYACKLSR